MRIDSIIMKGINGQLYLPELIARTDASSDATVQFALSGSTEYKQYMLFFTDLMPDTDAVNLRLRFSTDGGSTYYSTAGDYAYAISNMTTIVTQSISASAAQIRVQGINNVGSALGEGITGWIYLMHLGGGSGFATAMVRNVMQNSATSSQGAFGTGQLLKSGEVITNVQLDFSSGNIASGKLALYGIPAVI